MNFYPFRIEEMQYSLVWLLGIDKFHGYTSNNLSSTIAVNFNSVIVNLSTWSSANPELVSRCMKVGEIFPIEYNGDQ